MHPVAQKKPNAWGLYDVIGNRWHWLWVGSTGGYGDLSTAYDREYLFFLTDADPLIHQKVAFASASEVAAGFPSVDMTERHATDWFIIASGTSDAHVRGIAQAVLTRLDAAGVRAHHVEGLQSGRWVLLDFVDVVVHLFHPEARAFYQLERLWHDAPRLATAAERKFP